MLYPKIQVLIEGGRTSLPLLYICTLFMLLGVKFCSAAVSGAVSTDVEISPLVLSEWLRFAFGFQAESWRNWELEGRPATCFSWAFLWCLRETAPYQNTNSSDSLALCLMWNSLDLRDIEAAGVRFILDLSELFPKCNVSCSEKFTAVWEQAFQNVRLCL